MPEAQVLWDSIGWLAPLYPNFLDIFSAFSVCPTVLVYMQMRAHEKF